jgi:predicted secreted protein
MTLADVIEHLDDLDESATIYAQSPWSAESRAVVAVEPEGGLPPAEAAGLEYFLEVNVARDIAALASSAACLDSVIYYAENDAYLSES